MLRNLALVVGYTAFLVLFTAPLISATQFGTADEANAMLERAMPP